MHLLGWIHLEEDKVALLFRKEENLKVNVDVNMSISLEKSEILFEVNTTLLNRENDETVFTHTGKTTFSIQNLKSTFNKEEEKFELPDNFMVQLYALSYSHARALLSVELTKTVYKDLFYLPVINPTIILNK